MFKRFSGELQYDIMDCGAACLKAICKSYGKFYSLQFIRDKCGITREGVSFLDLSYAAEELGLRSLPVRATVGDLRNKVPLPCIVHWKNSHFTTVYHVNKKYVFVFDPSIGNLKFTYDEFENGWIPQGELKGNVLALETTASFLSLYPGEKIRKGTSFQKVLSYFANYSKSIWSLMIAMLIATGLQAILPFVTKSIIDIGIEAKDMDFIHLILIANISIIVSITLSNIVRDWILLHITARVNIAIISDYLIKLMLLPITFFETKMTGDILQRANDHERIRTFIMTNSLNLVFSTLTFLVFSIVLATYNQFIFYCFLAGTAIYVCWILAFMRFRKKLDWDYFTLTSKNQTYWVETIGSIQEIKINNYEKTRRWKWEAIQARLYKTNLRLQSLNNIQNTGARLIDSLKTVAISYLSAKAVIEGEITMGMMISIQTIIGTLNAPISQLIQFISSAQSAQISFARINEIHQLDNESENMGENSIDLPEKKHIQFKNVFFQYSKNSTSVLKGINVTIPEKKVTAIVGTSGSGKSTLLKLILRLHKPTNGDLYVGSMNLNNISLKQWRDCCGSVMQDGKIFNDTILNNIVMNDQSVDYNRLKSAVDTANIAEEIEQMPLGYQTLMGESGRGISGGQRQRLLVARALYKNPSYLFFDEATNSLDTINEEKIVNSLQSVFANKTVIVIAHRLSTIRNADQIIVMQNGMIREVGNHENLMEKKGHYFQLVGAQVSAAKSNLQSHSPILT